MLRCKRVIYWQSLELFEKRHMFFAFWLISLFFFLVYFLWIKCEYCRHCNKWINLFWKLKMVAFISIMNSFGGYYLDTFTVLAKHVATGNLAQKGKFMKTVFFSSNFNMNRKWGKFWLWLLSEKVLMFIMEFRYFIFADICPEKRAFFSDKLRQKAQSKISLKRC